MQFTKTGMAAGAVCLLLGWVILQPARSAPPMIAAPKWEYKTDINSGMASITQLNQAGSEGWELVTVAVENSGNTTSVYKRLKK